MTQLQAEVAQLREMGQAQACSPVTLTTSHGSTLQHEMNAGMDISKDTFEGVAEVIHSKASNNVYSGSAKLLASGPPSPTHMVTMNSIHHDRGKVPGGNHPLNSFGMMGLDTIPGMLIDHQSMTRKETNGMVPNHSLTMTMRMSHILLPRTRGVLFGADHSLTVTSVEMRLMIIPS